MRKIAFAAIAGTLVLSACNSKPEEAPVENETLNITVDEPVVNEVVNIVEPEKPVVNETPPAAPPPEVSEEEQMLDDADATGLTSRLPRSDDAGAGSTENETRPAE
ncbi:hypothetical protein [Sphingomonas sp. C3-2]|uniref:hypothetical protein n=1 Tax=Sphingomonas sp. C3-2 TaxID=3062169 RepID=UPI00294B0F71|nr:hypothetical protein [Sphingomonas sp. C3-2]WOK36540.1 hypothetical protein QYC26_16310 [Sphingomonas sp. C3-2]